MRLLLGQTSQWLQQFQRWIERGSPGSVLSANTFFDFRPLFGRSDFAHELRSKVMPLVRSNERFLKQMSEAALQNSPPLSWTGGLFNSLLGPEPDRIDLKMHGTACFVDAARLLALANGVEATGTVARFEALEKMGRVPVEEARNWTDAFLFLQSLRLRVQQRIGGAGSGWHQSGIDQHADKRAETPLQTPPLAPNHIVVRDLSELDRRILKEAFRQSRKLQQRIGADYP